MSSRSCSPREVVVNLVDGPVVALSTPAGWWIAVSVAAVVLSVVALRGCGLATN